MELVKVTCAKANLSKLLARVAQGERIVICRYNIPVAELGPPAKVERPKPKFGTGKGRAALIDPRAFEPMTDEEADAFCTPC